MFIYLPDRLSFFATDHDTDHADNNARINSRDETARVVAGGIRIGRSVNYRSRRRGLQSTHA